MDSGSQISVMNPLAVPWLNKSNTVGHVLLGGVLDREKKRASVHRVSCKLVDPGQPNNVIPIETQLLVAVA